MGNTLPPGLAPLTPDQVQSALASISNAYILKPGVRIRQGKVIKTIPCTTETHGRLALKVFMRRDASQDTDIVRCKDKMEQLHNLFTVIQHPAIALWQHVETNKVAVFAARQFMTATLAERRSGLPPLTSIECRWIIFQLLCAVARLHEIGICHGDITPSNVLLTSWDWCYLTDFPLWKPTYLPLDDPSEFMHYFSTCDQQNRCYVAPERFTPYGLPPNGPPPPLFGQVPPPPPKLSPDDPFYYPFPECFAEPDLGIPGSLQQPQGYPQEQPHSAGIADSASSVSMTSSLTNSSSTTTLQRKLFAHSNVLEQFDPISGEAPISRSRGRTINRSNQTSVDFTNPSLSPQMQAFSPSSASPGGVITDLPIAAAAKLGLVSSKGSHALNSASMTSFGGVTYLNYNANRHLHAIYSNDGFKTSGLDIACLQYLGALLHREASIARYLRGISPDALTDSQPYHAATGGLDNPGGLNTSGHGSVPGATAENQSSAPFSTSTSISSLHLPLQLTIPQLRQKYDTLCVQDRDTVNRGAAQLLSIRGGGSDGLVDPAMDIFSLGCTIAELVSESGRPLFSLAQLHAYRQHGYAMAPTTEDETRQANSLASEEPGSNEPNSKKVPSSTPQSPLLAALDDISDPISRALVAHMIQVDPARRWSARYYLARLTQIGYFPPAFHHIYRFMTGALIGGTPALRTPDQKVAQLRRWLPVVLRGTLPAHELDALRQITMNARAALLPEASQADYYHSTSLHSQLHHHHSHHDAVARNKKRNEEFALSQSRRLPQRLLRRLRLGLERRRDHLEERFRTALQVIYERSKVFPAMRMAPLTFETLDSSLHPAEWLAATKVPLRSACPALDGLLYELSSDDVVVGPIHADIEPDSTEKVCSKFGIRNEKEGSRIDKQGTESETSSIEVLPLPRLHRSIYHDPMPTDSFLPLVTYVCANLQHVAGLNHKLAALELLVELSCFVEDRTKVGRIVPPIVATICDRRAPALVRAAALHSLLTVLAPVHYPAQEDLMIFQSFILPSITSIHADAEDLVRIAFAQTIVPFYELAFRFLDIAAHRAGVAVEGRKALRDAAKAASIASKVGSDAVLDAATSRTTGQSQPNGMVGDKSDRHNSHLAAYDHLTKALQSDLVDIVVAILTRDSGQTKTALLPHLARAFELTGRGPAVYAVLPHVLGLMTHRDWRLRARFFEHLGSLAVLVGKTAFRDFVLPSAEQASADPHPSVVFACLRSLRNLVRVGIIEPRLALSTVANCLPVLVHPSAAARGQAIALVETVIQMSSPPLQLALLFPKLEPYLLCAPGALMSLPKGALAKLLRPPLTRKELASCAMGEIPATYKYAPTPQALKEAQAAARAENEERLQASAAAMAAAMSPGNGAMVTGPLKPTRSFALRSPPLDPNAVMMAQVMKYADAMRSTASYVATPQAAVPGTSASALSLEDCGIPSEWIATGMFAAQAQAIAQASAPAYASAIQPLYLSQPVANTFSLLQQQPLGQSVAASNATDPNQSRSSQLGAAAALVQRYQNQNQKLMQLQIQQAQQAKEVSAIASSASNSGSSNSSASGLGSPGSFGGASGDLSQNLQKEQEETLWGLDVYAHPETLRGVHVHVVETRPTVEAGLLPVPMSLAAIAATLSSLSAALTAAGVPSPPGLPSAQAFLSQATQLLSMGSSGIPLPPIATAHVALSAKQLTAAQLATLQSIAFALSKSPAVAATFAIDQALAGSGFIANPHVIRGLALDQRMSEEASSLFTTSELPSATSTTALAEDLLMFLGPSVSSEDGTRLRLWLETLLMWARGSNADICAKHVLHFPERLPLNILQALNIPGISAVTNSTASGISGTTQDSTVASGISGDKDMAGDLSVHNGVTAVAAFTPSLNLGSLNPASTSLSKTFRNFHSILASQVIHTRRPQKLGPMYLQIGSPLANALMAGSITLPNGLPNYSVVTSGFNSVAATAEATAAAASVSAQTAAQLEAYALRALTAQNVASNIASAAASLGIASGSPLSAQAGNSGQVSGAGSGATDGNSAAAAIVSAAAAAGLLPSTVSAVSLSLLPGAAATAAAVAAASALNAANALNDAAQAINGTSTGAYGMNVSSGALGAPSSAVAALAGGTPVQLLHISEIADLAADAGRVQAIASKRGGLDVASPLAMNALQTSMAAPTPTANGNGGQIPPMNDVPEFLTEALGLPSASQHGNAAASANTAAIGLSMGMNVSSATGLLGAEAADSGGSLASSDPQYVLMAATAPHVEALHSRTDPGNWRPRGVLASTLQEHQDAITGLAVARDNSFIASASKDGVLKIWETNAACATARPESAVTWTPLHISSYSVNGAAAAFTAMQNNIRGATPNGMVHSGPVSARVGEPWSATSALSSPTFTSTVHSAHGARYSPSGSGGLSSLIGVTTSGPLGGNSAIAGISSMVICDSSRTVAVGCDDGTCHLIRVDHGGATAGSINLNALGTSSNSNATGPSSASARITNLKTLASEMGSVVCIEHFNTLNESLLIVGMHDGTILGWDCRAANPAFSIRQPPQLGALSVLAVGPSPYSIHSGSYHGAICTYDLRVSQPVSLFSLPSKQRVRLLMTEENPAFFAEATFTGGLCSDFFVGNEAEILGLGSGPVPLSRCGPLLIATSDYSADLAAYDVLTGHVRAVFRSAMPVSAPAPIMPFLDGPPPVQHSQAQQSFATLQHLQRLSLSERAYAQTSAFRSAVGFDGAHHVAANPLHWSIPRPPCVTDALFCQGDFVITASTDSVLRFWDIRDPLRSYRITGEIPGVQTYHSTRPWLVPSTSAGGERFSPVLEGESGPIRQIQRGDQIALLMQEHTSNPTAGVGAATTPGAVSAARLHPTIRPGGAHAGSISFLRALEFPHRLLITAGGSEIKLWA